MNKIEHIELRNFTGFKNLSLNLSPMVNLIVGENGSGKTNLLKVAYSLFNTSIYEKESNYLAQALTSKMIRNFLPLDGKIGKFCQHGAKEETRISLTFDNNERTVVSFNKNSKVLKIRESLKNIYKSTEAVFIPTKEVISFADGFISLYEKYEISFDQTYKDICLLLDLPKARPEILPEKSKWAMSAIEKIYDGYFIFHGGGKVTFKSNVAEYSPNAIAEGFRKLGIFTRLLENGSIQPGISGPIFWDEPDSNLNPNLIKTLVEVLLELSRAGQQIILTTHDYVLSRWFETLMDEGKGDHLRFHNLNIDKSTSEITVATTDNYLPIGSNSIDEAFKQLFEENVGKSIGVLDN